MKALTVTREAIKTIIDLLLELIYFIINLFKKKSEWNGTKSEQVSCQA